MFRTNIAGTKGVQVWENVKVNLKLEVFDLFHQKTWGVPQEGLANNQFGIIIKASGNRSMQLSLRVVFY